MPAPSDGWVVVSGANGALGRAIVSHFSDRGKPVLALDRQFDGALPAGVSAHSVDLLSESDVRKSLSEAIPADQSFALLVNAVGLIWNEPTLAFRNAKLTTHSLDSWQKVIDANLTAPFIVAAQVAARMARRGGGSIVNFSSIASAGNAGQVAYSAAKAGVEAMTRTMASELGPLGVRVNALALGFIDVATTRHAVAEERLEDYVRRTSLGRLGSVSDVITAIEFLSESAFTNGTIMQLDGGLRL